jgi:hypothetical protein
VRSSVTVTEKSKPGEKDTPEERGEVEARSLTSGQMSEPRKCPSSVSPGDEALRDFSSVVCRLVQITRNKRAVRYAKTSVSVDELVWLGKFLTDIANLKVSGAGGLALPGTGAASVERSAVNAEYRTGDVT